jgi:LmbE family N-acetylglucosaminyl deacetylase
MGLRSRIGGLADRSGLGWVRRLFGRRAQNVPLFALPELIDKPAGTRALVLAPHADDEALGCGGVVYKHHLAGDHVTAVFMTDGSQGYEMAGTLRGQALIEAREQEARAAAEILGIGQCLFLRNADAALEASPATVAQLQRVLEARRPDIVYVPSPLDTHRDHRQTCAIAARALANCSWELQVYLYELWSPITANCAVIIDLDRKLQAIRCYRSQMDERQLYLAVASNLARYRGLTCLPGQDVRIECFLRLDRAAFAELAWTVA